MDISTFVEETLMGIKNGIERSNKRAKGTYFEMMHHDKIDFDVALVVSQKQGKKGGAKIGIASVVSAGGDVSTENQDEKSSRIKFSIKIGFNSFGAVAQ